MQGYGHGQKILLGHIVRVWAPKDPYTGVVHNIENIGSFQNPQYRFTIYRHTDEGEYFETVVRPTNTYKEWEIINLQGITTLQNRERIAKLFHSMDDPYVLTPRKNGKARRRIRRKSTIVDNGLKPDTKYDGKLEVFVHTRDAWFTLERTTKKMAFFNGGRCLIENITRTRDPQTE